MEEKVILKEESKKEHEKDGKDINNSNNSLKQDEAKIKQLEEENKTLNNKLSDTIKSNDKMKKDIEKYKMENIKLNEELIQANNLKQNLEKYEKENKKLNEELIKANKIISNLLINQVNSNELQKLRDENNNLKLQINSKDKEIQELKNIIKNNKIEVKNVNFEDIMVINFISQDSSVHYGIKCLPNDIFAEIEEKLYKKYDNLRETNNTFMANARPVLRFKKLNENNIHDGDIIQLFQLE